VNLRCLAADGEELPFPDECFDAVWGNAILHHLDLVRAGRELYRVLKPGGGAVFCEPWGGNPLLSFARRFLPYPGKDRTPDEQPHIRGDLDPLREIFPSVEVEGHQLLGMLRRAWRSNRTGNRPHLLDRIDAGLLGGCPLLKNWCRYVVIRFAKS
jgi:SAM-dependent methyltransferase